VIEKGKEQIERDKGATLQEVKESEDS